MSPVVDPSPDQIKAVQEIRKMEMLLAEGGIPPGLCEVGYSHGGTGMADPEAGVIVISPPLTAEQNEILDRAFRVMYPNDIPIQEWHHRTEMD